MYASSRTAPIAGMIAILLATVLGAAAPEPAASTTAPAETAAPTPSLDPTIDKILTRLETRDINDLHAKVSWKLKHIIDSDEDALTKHGEIWYQRVQPVPRFLIHFQRKVVSKRQHKLDERHMFDGRWYIEMNSETRSFVRREVRREGDTSDPYRIGEGPFPVPFGQKKADILREFDVALVPPAERDPENTDHLRLTPRPGSPSADSYKVVDVWIAQEGRHAGLPIQVETAKLDGTGTVNSTLTITFSEAKLNSGFSGGVFELEPPRGYDVQEERLDPVPTPTP